MIKRRFKIIFILNMLTKRGAQIQLFNLINRLPDHIDVCVFAFTSNSSYHEFENSKRFKFYTGRHRRSYNPLMVVPFLRCLFKNRFDVAITMGLGASLFLGRIGAVLRGIPVIYTTLHQFRRFNAEAEEYFDFLNGLINKIFPLIKGHKVLRFLPVSEKLSNKIRSDLRNYPVHTLNNGITLQEIKALSAYVPSNFTRSLSSELNGKPVIVQVGSLDTNKNVIFSLKSIKNLTKVFSDLRFLVIGSGPTKDELKDWVKQNDLESHVIFTGRLERMDCLYLMSKSKLLVLTSHSEAFPNVLVEAQALSIPVVTLDVGGASEIVENNINGYVLKKNDRKGFEQAISKILYDANLRDKLGVNGKHIVFSRFTLDNKIEKLLNLIENDLAYYYNKS